MSLWCRTRCYCDLVKLLSWIFLNSNKNISHYLGIPLCLILFPTGIDAPLENRVSATVTRVAKDVSQKKTGNGTTTTVLKTARFSCFKPEFFAENEAYSHCCKRKATVSHFRLSSFLTSGLVHFSLLVELWFSSFLTSALAHFSLPVQLVSHLPVELISHFQFSSFLTFRLSSFLTSGWSRFSLPVELVSHFWLSSFLTSALACFSLPVELVAHFRLSLFLTSGWAHFSLPVELISHFWLSSFLTSGWARFSPSGWTRFSLPVELVSDSLYVMWREMASLSDWAVSETITSGYDCY